MLLVAALLIGLAPSPQEERKPSLTGNIKMHREFASQHLNSKRDLIVYLPPGYASGSRERYPVLYMGDGQNLFDGMTSFIPNKEWRLDEAAESLILSKLIEPIIIVGIYNGGMERADEYLPTRSKVGNTEAGGKADIFARMVVEEIKPMIDRTYRTRTGREDTAIGGSSFGGIMALHLALTRPDVFGKAAVVSPSVWWDDRVMLKRIEALKTRPKVKMWVDMGTAEGERGLDDATALSRALQTRGWRLGEDLAYFVHHGAGHNEDAWAQRSPAMLMFLFGGR